MTTIQNGIASFKQSTIGATVMSRRDFLAALLAAFIGAIVFAPQRITLASVSLDIDLDPLFTAINDNLPTFMSVFAIVGGIAIAIIIVKFIINAIIDAFKGGKLT